MQYSPQNIQQQTGYYPQQQQYSNAYNGIVHPSTLVNNQQGYNQVWQQQPQTINYSYHPQQQQQIYQNPQMYYDHNINQQQIMQQQQVQQQPLLNPQYSQILHSPQQQQQQIYYEQPLQPQQQQLQSPQQQIQLQQQYYQNNIHQNDQQIISSNANINNNNGNDIQLDNKKKDYIEDEFKRNEYSNVINTIEDQSYDPSTIGIIDSQLLLVKHKEEQNVSKLNLKRKENPVIKETTTAVVVGPTKKNNNSNSKDEKQKEQKQFKDVKDMSFIQLLMRDFNQYFPTKTVSVFLREYCSKIKVLIDITCDDNEKGLGFNSQVIIDGKKYPAGLGKNKKDAKEDASVQALTKLCKEDPSAKKHFISVIDKEKSILEKFSSEKQKSLSSDNKNQAAEITDEEMLNYNPLQNYREELTSLAQQILRLTVSYEMKGDSNNWETICNLGKLVTTGNGLTQKDAKNIASFKMIHLVEQSNENTVKRLAKRALIKQKVDQTNQKLKELEELKSKQTEEQQVKVQIETQQQQIEIEKEKKENEQALQNMYSCQLNQNYECKSKLETKQKSNTVLINSCLNKFKTKYKVHDDVYVQLKTAFDLLISNKQKFECIGIVDFAIVGSYEFKLLRSYEQSIDVIFNYNIINNLQDKNNIVNDTFKIIQQLFTDNTYENTIKINPSNNQSYISVRNIQLKDQEMKIYFSYVQLGIFNNDVHHVIWLSEYKQKIVGNAEISTFMKYLRHWRNQYNINAVPIAIFDFIAYAVTNKFTQSQPSRSLINFFEFVANDGLKDVVKENKRNIDVTQMHFEMISEISKENYDSFKLQCSNIYNQSDYQFLKSV